MVNFKLFNIGVLLFSVLLAGCTSLDECREDKTVNMKIGFYQKTDLTDVTIKVDSLWVNGLEKDSFLYSNSKSANSVSIPLNAARQQSDFIIKFNNTTDTLSVFYTPNNAYFISFECGCIATQTIDEVISTNHFIDSVRIVQREVINVNAEHIKIFHN